jgi:hypothetical protein
MKRRKQVKQDNLKYYFTKQFNKAKPSLETGATKAFKPILVIQEIGE